MLSSTFVNGDIVSHQIDQPDYNSKEHGGPEKRETHGQESEKKTVHNFLGTSIKFKLDNSNDSDKVLLLGVEQVYLLEKNTGCISE